MKRDLSEALRPDLEQLSPAEAEKTAIRLEARIMFGPEAGIVVVRMFDERNIDPTAPEFDKQMFLKEVQSAMNG